MLTTGIATAYADLAGYYADLDVAQDAIRIRGASADLSAKRTAAGLDNQATQRQAESRAASARGDVAAIEAIALTRNRLAALIGAGPDRGRTIARPALAAPSLALPPQAGIDLVGRRPDIVAARLRAEAAAKRIGARRLLSNIPVGARRAPVARAVEPVQDRVRIWQWRRGDQPADLRGRAAAGPVSRGVGRL
ncbi:MAG: hypothetical protein R3D52_14795 [Xanthobacteraceae bacterium]